MLALAVSVLGLHGCRRRAREAQVPASASEDGSAVVNEDAEAPTVAVTAVSDEEYRRELQKLGERLRQSRAALGRAREALAERGSDLRGQSTGAVASAESVGHEKGPEYDRLSKDVASCEAVVSATQSEMYRLIQERKKPKERRVFRPPPIREMSGKTGKVSTIHITTQI